MENNTRVKKNKSTYLFFSADERVIIKKEKPDLTNKQVLTEIGSRWKVFKEDESSERMLKYKKLASEDKERYVSEKENSSTRKPESKIDEGTTLAEEEKVPKKNKTSAYIVYCKDNRDKLKKEFVNLTPKEITNKLNDTWKSLSDDEKVKYKTN